MSHKKGKLRKYILLRKSLEVESSITIAGEKYSKSNEDIQTKCGVNEAGTQKDEGDYSNFRDEELNVTPKSKPYSNGESLKYNLNSVLKEESLNILFH